MPVRLKFDSRTENAEGVFNKGSKVSPENCPQDRLRRNVIRDRNLGIERFGHGSSLQLALSIPSGWDCVYFLGGGLMGRVTFSRDMAPSHSSMGANTRCDGTGGAFDCLETKASTKA